MISRLQGRLLASLMVAVCWQSCLRADDRIEIDEISKQLGANLKNESAPAAMPPARMAPLPDPAGDVAPVSVQPASYAGVPDLPASQQLDVNQFPEAGDWKPESPSWWQKLEYDLSLYGRGAYQYDHRIWFTGQASDFSVEGGLYGYLQTTESAWTTRLDCELYINQPFDRNRLVDTPQRMSYDPNFALDVLEISQLVISARNEDWLFAAGKMVTPFGRFYFPLFTNRMDDAPFIRTEAILWRETGLLAQYDPDMFVATFAFTNGGFDRDANSSKAIIARLGLQEENWAVGSSVKWQDGIGSEGQKETNNHVGLDAMYRHGQWVFSGEVIYDEYGLRRGDLMLDDIFWGRSLYNRQLQQAIYGDMYGVGYYLDVGYLADHWQFHVNYGEYHPKFIGERIHDTVSRRGIVKGAYNFNKNFAWYTMLMLENTVKDFEHGHDRKGIYVLTGVQASL